MQNLSKQLAKGLNSSLVKSVTIQGLFRGQGIEFNNVTAQPSSQPQFSSRSTAFLHPDLPRGKRVKSSSKSVKKGASSSSKSPQPPSNSSGDSKKANGSVEADVTEIFAAYSGQAELPPTPLSARKPSGPPKPAFVARIENTGSDPVNAAGAGRVSREELRQSPSPHDVSDDSPANHQSDPIPPTASKAQRSGSEGASWSKYCAEQVRVRDYDHYLQSLLLPGEGYRAAFWALRALNIELVQTLEGGATGGNSAKGRSSIVGSEDLSAAARSMRLAWWENALDAIWAGNPPAHPVAQGLAYAAELGVSKRWVARAVDGRMDEAERGSKGVGRPVSASAIEKAAEKTGSSLYYAALEAAGVRDLAADHAVSHLAKAAGLAVVIRGTARAAGVGRVLLPREEMIAARASDADVLRGMGGEQVSDAVFAVASLAEGHVHSARTALSSVPEAAKPMMLIGVAIEDFLLRLQGVDFDPFHPSVAEAPGLKVQAKMALARWRGSW